MFFVTYLRRELSGRAHQAIVVMLGLAVGVGLVVTVSAASTGVARAEPEVLGTLYGVDTRDVSLGPLGSGSLVSGRSFTTAEADANVAVVDSGYPKSQRLTVGSAVSMDGVRCTVIGIVSQPPARRLHSPALGPVPAADRWQSA